MHFCIFPENILFLSKRAILTRKMLVQTNHLTLLKSAMREMEMRDSNIVFLCSDGRITCRSTHFKIHSKFLQKILSEIPNGLQEFVIHLPDIPKSHMSHLVSLMSQGSSNFNSRKLSNVDSLSNVINNVLVTADLLGVQISNYGFDLADEEVADLNNIKKEPSEYCEIESVLIKSEIVHGKPDNNLLISPELRTKYKRLINNQQNKSYSEIMPDEDIDIEGTNSVSGKNPAPSETKHNLNMSKGKLRKLTKRNEFIALDHTKKLRKLERKQRKKKIQRLKALGLLQDQSIQDLPLGPQWVAGPPPYSHGNVGISSSPEDSAPIPEFDMRTSLPPHSPSIQPTQSSSPEDSAPVPKFDMRASSPPQGPPIQTKKLGKKLRKKKIQRLKALGLLQDQSLQDLPLGPQWVAGPPPYSHGNVGKSSSPEVSAPMPDMRTSHLPHSPPIQPTQPRTTCDSLGNAGNLYNNQQQREQQTFSSASAPVFGKSLSLLKQKPKLNATFH